MNLGENYTETLTVYPNDGDSVDNSQWFVNNVEYNGIAAGDLPIGRAGDSATLYARAYVTRTVSGSSVPSMKYTRNKYAENSDNEFVDEYNAVYGKVTITATTPRVYGFKIEEFDKSGRITFEATKGCGNLIITDIWLDYN